jgi:hypothetical protein
MDYKMSWYELKGWIETSVSHLTVLMDGTEGKEYDRLKSKREGFIVMYQYMLESEKMYKNEQDELDEKIQEMTTDELNEFFEQVDEQKIVGNLLKAFEK